MVGDGTWSRSERIVSRLAFPIVMTASVWATLAWIGAGRDPESAVAFVIPAAGLVILVLERFFPHHRSWLHSKGDLGPDIAYAVGIGTMVSTLLGPAVAYLGVRMLGWLSLGFGGTLWPNHWPILAQLIVALVVAEFPKYWNHRLQHNVDLLWRIHATHHSAPRLYWLNAARFHPIDLFIDGVLGGVTLVALGCQIELIVVFTVVSGVHGFFQHANLRLRLGFLNYFFSMAELHRWHHSKTLDEANNNYGQNVIIWDLVFGTFFLPTDREPPKDIGIPDLPAFPMTFWQQLASPFTWSGIKRRSAVMLNR